MTVTTLTVANVAAAMDELLVERGPDYIYPKERTGDECYYSFEDGSPACLIGAIIAKVDPDGFEAIKEYEAPSDDGNGAIHREAIGSVHNLVVGELVTIESPALFAALNTAQRTQDSGHTWAAARHAFIVSVNNAR